MNTRSVSIKESLCTWKPSHSLKRALGHIISVDLLTHQILFIITLVPIRRALYIPNFGDLNDDPIFHLLKSNRWEKC
jgi:hypothetical protein